MTLRQLINAINNLAVLWRLATRPGTGLARAARQIARQRGEK